MEFMALFKSGQHFGDNALLRNKPRQGTVLCVTGCFFAVISSQAYEQLMRKEKLQQLALSVAFLRPIPYMEDWKTREIQIISLLSKEGQTENRGQIIAHEGAACDKIFIILEGEVEIVRTNLS